MTEPNENNDPKISNNQIENLGDYIKLYLTEPLTAEEKKTIAEIANWDWKFIAYNDEKQDEESSLQLSIFPSYYRHIELWEEEKRNLPDATLVDAGFYTVIGDINCSTHIISFHSETLANEITFDQIIKTRAWLRKNSGIEVEDPN